jgi:TolA-binding protein
LQKLELEQLRIKLSESEKLMEERRLQAELQIEKIGRSMELLQRPIAAPQTPQIVQMEKPKKKKRGTIITDDVGNPVGIEITEEPEKRVGKLITDETGNVLGMEMD